MQGSTYVVIFYKTFIEIDILFHLTVLLCRNIGHTSHSPKTKRQRKWYETHGNMPGYTETFVEKFRKRCFCPICGLPMKNPVKIMTCGHRFCECCLQEFLR